MAGEVIEHRNRLRKPLTPFAARLLANKFRLTPDPNAAATVMIEKGWQGFDPSWAGTDQPATIRGAKPNGPDNNTNLVSAVKRHQEILRRAEELGGTVEYGWRPDNSWGLNVILPET
jgi:type IV secretory pathway TrbL component